MKKDLLIVPIYIAITLFLSLILAVFFVLCPLPQIETIDYSLYALDIFLYAFLYLCPMMAVVALVVMVLRIIKIGTYSMLSFLTYVFLCLAVWLILIPLFLFFSPELKVSFLLTGVSPSPATIFFTPDSFNYLAQSLEMYSIQFSDSLFSIFSDLLLLRDKALEAGKNGRITYLFYASLGLALSSLYSLRSISKWKLINVANILFLWCAIVWINAQIYRYDWDVLYSTKLTVFVFNCIITFVILILGLVTSAKQKITTKEGN